MLLIRNTSLISSSNTLLNCRNSTLDELDICITNGLFKTRICVMACIIPKPSFSWDDEESFWIGLTKMKITADNNPDKIRIVIITMGTRHRFRLLRILERRGTVIFSASFAARSRLKVLSNGFLVANAEMKPSSILLLSISG